MSAQLILTIIPIIIKHGPDAVVAIGKLLEKKKDVTPEDIEKLFITKRPEEYFKPR